MRLYQLAVSRADTGTSLSWHSSKEAASKALTQIVKEEGIDRDAGLILPTEITPTREGLLKWLNVHFTTDNG
jgi:hypothetical protein